MQLLRFGCPNPETGKVSYHGRMGWTPSYCTLDRSTMFELPETLEQQARAAAAAGFSLMSLDLFSLRAYRDAHSGVHRLRDVLDENGLATFDLSGITVTDDRVTTLAELDEFDWLMVSSRPSLV